MARQKQVKKSVLIKNKDQYPWVEWLESPQLAGTVGSENLFLLGHDPEELGAAVMARSHSETPTELDAFYMHELRKFSQDKITLTIDI